MTKENYALTFRHAGEEDYPALLNIQKRAYQLKEAPLYGENMPPVRETPELLAREAAGGKRRLLAEHDGVIVGSVKYEIREDGSVYWGRLSVNPDLMGRGIGQRLVQAIEDVNGNATSFVLDVGENSAENFHIYTKLGYVKTGESFQVPDGPYVIVMRKAGRL